MIGRGYRSRVVIEQCVTVDDVHGEDARRRPRARVSPLCSAEVVGEDLQQVLAALGDVVGEQLDAVDATSARAARGGVARSRSCRTEHPRWRACARRTGTRKLPDPQAGSRKRESMRSVSRLTRSSIASTIHGGREHLPVVSDPLLRPHAAERRVPASSGDEHRLDVIDSAQRAGVTFRNHRPDD